MADLQETLDLRRRARRRLIGAIALVLALVIVPPMVMDLEPKPVQSKLTVEIPSQDAARLKPPPKPSVPEPVKPPEPAPKAQDAARAGETPKPADAAKAAPAQSAPKSMDARTVAALGAPKTAEPEPAPVEEKPKPAPRPAEAKPADTKPADAKPAESAKKPAETAAARPEGYVVALGSFSNAENVRQLQARLAKEGIQTYTEAVKTASGEQTRVRAGPYASREAAEKARERVKGMGLDAGNVIARQ